MPLPFIIGGIALAAGIGGAGAGIHGGMKMKDANDTMKLAKNKQENAIHLFEKRNSDVTERMDKLGILELEIASSFKEFADTIEKIQGRPKFKRYDKNGVNLPDYEAEELKNVSAAAGVALGGIGGAAAGTAGGFAAAGATTAAVMALGTASTGAAISSLSGVAATNATLAALGGGAIAAGGGGMALGTAVLGGATLGVGLLVGGIIFNVTGSKLSEKADEAYEQAQKTEKEVYKIVKYLDELEGAAAKFMDSLQQVNKVYRKHLEKLDYVVNFSEKTEWSEFTPKEKKMTENAVLLVGLLHKMCKTQIVLKSEKEDELNTVNRKEIDSIVANAEYVLEDVEDAA